jgi:hypothetical protein
MTEAKATEELPKNGKATSKSFSLAGCLIKIVVGLVLLGCGLFVLQSLLVPEVEDDKTVQIEQASSPESGEQQPDESEDTGPESLTDSISMKQVEEAKHPLDPLMDLADRGLEIIDTRYTDYSAKMLTQVRTGTTLHEENLMFIKVRHKKEAQGDQPKTPFSIYTRFLKPRAKVGQEAIWVEGKDDEQILGHGNGILNIKTVRLPPEGSFAMSGNRYPIFQIGFRNLIIKMTEFGKNDRKYGECDVQIDRNLKVDGRSCTLLTVTHPKKRDHFDYHIAKIYIDDEYEIPTGYEGYLWPEEEGGEPVLLEKYFYLDLKLNCGLKDFDFDITNPEYDYPKW